MTGSMAGFMVRAVALLVAAMNRPEAVKIVNAAGAIERVNGGSESLIADANSYMAFLKGGLIIR